MWMLFIGLAVGIGAGLYLPVSLPASVAPYVTMAILVSLDAVVGGARAQQQGNFLAREFVEGWAANLAIACALAFLGIRLDAQIHLGVAIALSLRIFHNFASARRAYAGKNQKSPA